MSVECKSENLFVCLSICIFYIYNTIKVFRYSFSGAITPIFSLAGLDHTKFGFSSINFKLVYCCHSNIGMASEKLYRNNLIRIYSKLKTGCTVD